MYIFDTWQDITPHITQLLGLGTTVVALRYVAPGGHSQWKTIKVPEARAIAATGGRIKLGLIAESGAVPIGSDAGQADGEWALRQAKLFGAPHGYFLSYAVDADTPEHMGQVYAAFKAFNDATDESLPRIFCYGAGRTCDLLAERGLIRGKWLTQSNGFTGTRHSLATGDYDLHQLMPTHLFGMDIDPNVQRDPAADLGFFAPTMAAPALPDAVYPWSASVEDVEALQLALNTKCNAGLAVDGRYGKATQAAVAAFQRMEKLEVDGIAGPLTIGKLKAA